MSQPHIRWLAAIGILTAAIVTVVPADAQENAPDISGTWTGTFVSGIQGGEGDLDFHATHADETMKVSEQRGPVFEGTFENTFTHPDTGEVENVVIAVVGVFVSDRRFIGRSMDQLVFEGEILDDQTARLSIVAGGIPAHFIAMQYNLNREK